jgi:hypothetical protein
MPYEDEAPSPRAYQNLPRYVEWSTYNTVREAWLAEIATNKLLRDEISRLQKELEGALAPSISSPQVKPNPEP